MPKLKLLILDAGVVIKLHEWELWTIVIDKCDVHLSSIVANKESRYHQVEDDEYDQDIDLKQAIDKEEITIFEVEPDDIVKFKSGFDPLYFADLDDGEAESLAFLVGQSDPYMISSGDAIVYKVLGNLNLEERGISLEEVLQRIGMGRVIQEWPYTKAFRVRNTQEGARDMIQGRGKN